MYCNTISNYLIFCIAFHFKNTMNPLVKFCIDSLKLKVSKIPNQHRLGILLYNTFNGIK